MNKTQLWNQAEANRDAEVFSKLRNADVIFNAIEKPISTILSSTFAAKKYKQKKNSAQISAKKHKAEQFHKNMGDQGPIHTNKRYKEGRFRRYGKN